MENIMNEIDNQKPALVRVNRTGQICRVRYTRKEIGTVYFLADSVTGSRVYNGNFSGWEEEQVTHIPNDFT